MNSCGCSNFKPITTGYTQSQHLEILDGVSNVNESNVEMLNVINTMLSNNKKCCAKTNKNLTSILVELNAMNENIIKLNEKFDLIIDSIDVGTDTNEWSDYIGKLLTKGTIVSYDGQDYMVMQDVYPDLTNAPNSEGMLAIYQVYYGEDEREWLYGEYVEIGWIRYEDDIRYIAIQNPNPNICLPSETPAIWSVIE